MSTYVWIQAVQRPFPIGLDTSKRPQWSVNFEAQAVAPVEQLEEEIAARLISEGVATALWNGSTGDIFIGPDAEIPVGIGPYVSIIDTGGTAPRSPHNSQAATDEHLSWQIIVTAQKYRTGRTTALAAWRALHGVRNTALAA